MQAVSVKVGDAYSSNYVNQLYKQLLTFDQNVVYCCMTDNREGLDPNIEVIPITDEFKERKWWNKTKLFKPGLFDKPTIYLDLDCFIHTDPNIFFDINYQNKLCLLKTYWFNEDLATKIHQCTINSSIMVIFENNCEPVWKEIHDHIEKLYKSFYGLDPWLYRRHMNNINFFKPGLAYSYKHGCVFPDDTQQNVLRQLPICIFDDTKNRDEVLNGLWRTI